MKRVILAALTAALLGLAVPAVALADAGAPGSTFPEQPGAPPACAVVTTNPGTGFGGHARPSQTALQILNGLVADACFGG
jgi:hypothetical protein